MPPVFRSIHADETLIFRQAMLWPDKPISHVMIPGDDTAHHVGAFANGSLIAVGSFYSAPPKARLRKLAVAPDHRGTGLGAGLVRHGARLMKDAGLQELWCDARQSACGFYEKLDFVISGEVFTKSGIPYVKAHLDLVAFDTGPN